MDPYVYMAYMCFLENNSMLYKSFWGKNRPYPSPIGWMLSEEKGKILYKIKRQYILEQEEKWKKFNAQHFLDFLKKHGFNR